jgi:hypothetical protein
VIPSRAAPPPPPHAVPLPPPPSHAVPLPPPPSHAVPLPPPPSHAVPLPPPPSHAVPLPPPPSATPPLAHPITVGAQPPPAPQFLPPSALPRPIDLAAPSAGAARPGARVRSRVLGIALFLKGTGAVLGVLFGTIGYFAMSHADPHTLLNQRPVTAIRDAMLGMLLLSAVQLVAVLGTLAWKRWGVYVLVTMATLSLLFAFRAEATSNAVYDLLGLAVFGIAIARHWADFE